MLSAAINEPQQMGFYDIFPWVSEENLPARGFYEKMGFAFSDEFAQTRQAGRKGSQRNVVYPHKHKKHKGDA